MLNARQRKYLKGLAHHLTPVATVGLAGVTDNVMREIDRDLRDHELIKIKVRCDDQPSLVAVRDSIMERTDAEHVQTIGHVVVLYRAGEEPRIALSAR